MRSWWESEVLVGNASLVLSPPGVGAEAWNTTMHRYRLLSPHSCCSLGSSWCCYNCIICWMQSRSYTSGHLQFLLPFKWKWSWATSLLNIFFEWQIHLFLHFGFSCIYWLCTLCFLLSRKDQTLKHAWKRKRTCGVGWKGKERKRKGRKAALVYTVE